MTSFKRVTDQPNKMVGLIFFFTAKLKGTNRGNEASNSIHEVLMCRSNTQLQPSVASDYIRYKVLAIWLLFFMPVSNFL